MIHQITHNKRSLSLHTRNDTDDAVIREIFKEKEYRHCETSIKNAQHTIIDIGAHIGIFSIYARTINPKVSIYAYEPERENFLYLKKNLKENRIKNIIISNTAVTNNIEQKELFLQKDSINHSLCLPTENSQKIQTTTLNKIFIKHSIEKCDLLKIDAEGSEFSILLSTPIEILNKINAIYLEYHEFGKHKHQELSNFLINQRYKIQVYPAHYDKRMGTIFAQKSIFQKKF